MHIRLLPDLAPAEWTHQAATHAVVALLVGLPLVQVTLAHSADQPAWRGWASGAVAAVPSGYAMSGALTAPPSAESSRPQPSAPLAPSLVSLRFKALLL